MAAEVVLAGILSSAEKGMSVQWCRLGKEDLPTAHVAGIERRLMGSGMPLEVVVPRECSRASEIGRKRQHGEGTGTKENAKKTDHSVQR